MNIESKYLNRIHIKKKLVNISIFVNKFMYKNKVPCNVFSHQGFYSSSEIGGEFSKEGSSDTDREEKLTRKDLVDEVRGIFEKKKMSVKKLNSELQLLSGDERLTQLKLHCFSCIHS